MGARKMERGRLLEGRRCQLWEGPVALRRQSVFRQKEGSAGAAFGRDNALYGLVSRTAGQVNRRRLRLV